VTDTAEAVADAPRALVIPISAVPVAVDMDTEKLAIIPSGIAEPVMPQATQMKLPV